MTPTIENHRCSPPQNVLVGCVLLRSRKKRITKMSSLVMMKDDEGWPSCHESVKPTIFFMTMAMMKDDQVIIRVSLRCQANNPLLPAQSFEDSLLLDIYCEKTRYGANLFQHSLTLDNNPYQFSPLFHEHLHWELILTFSDKPEIQLTLGHGVNGSDIRFQFFFY